VTLDGRNERSTRGTRRPFGLQLILVATAAAVGMLTAACNDGNGGTGDVFVGTTTTTTATVAPPVGGTLVIEVHPGDPNTVVVQDMNAQINEYEDVTGRCQVSDFWPDCQQK
jgi:hypothetical protein